MMNDPKYNPGHYHPGQHYPDQPHAGQPATGPTGERLSSIERAVRAFDRQEFVPPSAPGDMLPNALNPAGLGRGYEAGSSQAPMGQAPFGQPPMGQAPFGQPQYAQPQYAPPPHAQPQHGQPQHGQPQHRQAPASWQVQPGQSPLPQGDPYPGGPQALHAAPGVNPAVAPRAFVDPAAGAPFGRPGAAGYGQPLPGQPLPGQQPGMIASPGFPGVAARAPVNPGAGHPAQAHVGQHPASQHQAGPQAYAAPQGAPRAPGLQASGQYYPIDRRRLAEQGMLGTEAASAGQVEEFRIVKRQIIEQADDMRRRGGGGAAQRVMVCSAHAGEGKTFCAVNLAMSISAEKESEVLLVDFDIARASVLNLLGLPPGPGLMEAIVDHTVDVRRLVMATDIPGLSVLPGGRPTNSDTEYLASSRAAQVLDMLTEDSPQRIVLFDSPPARAASIPAELAKLMGQVVLVVLADSTSSGAIQDAASLLAGCPNVQLLLNSVQFSPNGRQFGSYHGYRG